MDFRVLGPLEVYGDGRRLDIGRRRERGLLGLLLLAAGATVQADRLLSLLWEGDPPPGARRQLSVNVSRLRGQLGGAGEALVADGLGYRLKVDPDTVDAHRFRSAVERAATVADPKARLALLEETVGLWRGPLLADALSDHARLRVGREFDELHAGAVELLCAAWLDVGADEGLVARLFGLAEQHPARDGPHVLLMRALDACGRTTEALEYYRDLRRRWVEEFGLEPAATIQETHRQLLRGYGESPAAAVPAPRAAPQPAAPWPVPWQLPADASTFTGREPELGALDALLPAGGTLAGPVVVAAITGTAGVGKTALAVHWAHRVADRFPDGNVYVDLRGYGPGLPVRPVDALAQVLRSLGVPPEQIPDDEATATALYRSVQAGRRRLIVLDNAHDAEHARPLLPGAPGSLAVVTSRSALTGLIIGGATMVGLDLLPSADARRFLARRIGPRAEREPDAVDELIALCSRLPLALAVVAARAAGRPAWTLASLAADLRTSRHPLARLADGGDAATDLRRVLSWSYHSLSRPAARLFRLTGLHPGPDISVAAVASLAVVEPDEAHDLVAELLRAHLMVETAPGRGTSHDLLLAYAVELGEAEDSAAERAAALRRLLDHYLHTAFAAALQLYPVRNPIQVPAPAAGVTPERPDGHDQARAWFDAEHPVLLAAIRRAVDAGLDPHAERLAWTVTDYLHRTGRWQDWVTCQTIAVAAARRLDDTAAQARAHRSLGRGLAQLGQFDRAHTEFGHALRLYAASSDVVGQAQTRLYEAFVLDRQRQHERALEAAQQALALYRAAEHLSGCANALNMVGWESTQLNRHREAAAYCTEALRLHERLDDAAGRAATLDSLGGIHHSLGEHEQAVDCYERSLVLFRQLGDRYQEAETLTHLGDLRTAVGDPDAAARAWREALAILEELGHADADAVRHRLGS
ncbi:SARP family transcriptional regulator [Virgisporangium aliadipatigenens]|uniref:SARP family transcriptional regulator n=1 Tax=Virgisporangium aliadipatigenens TaxID=741659 RepID=A0A8J4DQ14_9ACTN|nr:BTAD domain-containing putative transcriptional regulator [Virgisporangium aliadipatigenens]GIJ45238.1 SARP family transcriptional regulator [Virgisporangium aliadipatigenens]